MDFHKNGMGYYKKEVSLFSLKYKTPVKMMIQYFIDTDDVYVKYLNKTNVKKIRKKFTVLFVEHSKGLLYCLKINRI